MTAGVETVDVETVAGLPGVKLRAAASADLDSLLALEAACFDADRWSRQSWVDELEGDDRIVLVAESRTPGGDSSGPCQTYAEVVSAACFHAGPGTAELYRVMTAPGWRGLGLATLLLAQGCDWAGARGCTEILLEVRAGNDARALYADVGFTPLYERTNYYGPGLDACVMRCALEGGGDE